MYPTWGRNQQDELNRISIKYEKHVRKISKEDKLTAKEKTKRSSSFEGDGIMDKERDVKHQAKCIVKVDKEILCSSSQVPMIDVGGHIQTEVRSPRSPMSPIVQNVDDQSPIKIIRKDVEEMAKIVAMH